jgi:hypothetical protein
MLLNTKIIQEMHENIPPNSKKSVQEKIGEVIMEFSTGSHREPSWVKICENRSPDVNNLTF